MRYEHNGALCAQDFGYLSQFVEIVSRNVPLASFHFADHELAFCNRYYVNLMPMLAGSRLEQIQTWGEEKGLQPFILLLNQMLMQWAD